jgi:nucleotide-binding universal stress UspA family protein
MTTLTIAPRARFDNPAAENGVVVGVDGSAGGVSALRWAREEAERRQQGCTVIEVSRPEPHGVVDAWGQHPSRDERLALERTELSALVAAAGGTGPVDVEVRLGDPVEVLAEAGRQADLLVVGSRGHGGLRSLAPMSVSAALLHRAVGPTVVIPPRWTEAGDRYRRVVVGVDGSYSAGRALAWAADEARCRDAELVVVHAWHVPVVMTSAPTATVAVASDACRSAAQETLDEAVAYVESGDAIRVRPQLIEGAAGLELVMLAGAADLLVVGSRGRGGLAAALLGSTTRACVHHSQCAVAVIP